MKNLAEACKAVKEKGTRKQKEKMEEYLNCIKKANDIQSELFNEDGELVPDAAVADSAPTHDAFYTLIAYLKVYADNIRNLHRHLVDGNWQPDHEKLAEYYEKLDGFEDAVTEMYITDGHNEPDMSEAIAVVGGVLDTKTSHNAVQSYTYCKEYFDKLHDLFEDAKKMEEHPETVSEMETMQYWLRLEADYKLAKRLTKIDSVQ